jgi:Flp pilus assembly pilin Flp
LAFGWLPSFYFSSLGEVNVMNLKKSFLTLIQDEQGAELAEYAVGVALLVAIGIVVYKILGDSINDSQSGTAARVGNAVSDSGY